MFYFAGVQLLCRDEMKIMDKHYHSHTESGSSDVSSAPVLLVDAALLVSNTISYFFAVPR